MNARLPLDEQLRTALPDLTRAERQLATHVLVKWQSGVHRILPALRSA